MKEMYCLDCKYCELKEKYHRGEDWCKKYDDQCDHNKNYFCESYKPRFSVKLYNFFIKEK